LWSPPSVFAKAATDKSADEFFTINIEKDMKKSGFCQIKPLRKKMADFKVGHKEKLKYFKHHRAQLRVISIKQYNLLSQAAKSAFY